MAKRGFPWLLVISALLTFSIGIAAFIFLGDMFFPAERATPPEKIAKHRITVYFADKEGKFLKGETRSIKKSSMENEIEQTILELLKGPSDPLTPTMPEGTKLISIKIKGNVIYANFTGEISANHPGGSKGELLTIYSIVNTVALNFKEIKKVQILVNNDALETLAGHILISIPLGPDMTMIKG